MQLRAGWQCDVRTGRGKHRAGAGRSTVPRLPRLPRWLVWGWVMTAPWTLEYGTHIINPSYVLAPAVLVFGVGAVLALR